MLLNWTSPTIIDWRFTRVPVVVPGYGRCPATAVFSAPTVTITVSQNREKRFKEVKKLSKSGFRLRANDFCGGISQ
jgi:hypothetical protein